MNRTCRLITAAILVLGLLWNLPALSAVTPAEELQETWKQIIALLKTARFDSEPEIDAFRSEVMQVITPRFDFTEPEFRSRDFHGDKSGAVGGT